MTRRMSGTFAPSLMHLSSTSRMEERKKRAKEFADRRGESYLSQIDATRKRVQAMNARKRCVLHPNRNRWIGAWDLVSTLALLYTALLTPVETSFVASVYGPSAWADCSSEAVLKEAVPPARASRALRKKGCNEFQLASHGRRAASG